MDCSKRRKRKRLDKIFPSDAGRCFSQTFQQDVSEVGWTTTADASTPYAAKSAADSAQEDKRFDAANLGYRPERGFRP
jgi:hypothetical protein